ncbi:MAG: DUF2723 domain-containing protein [Chloroflexi bacterium]|nr:DUF2723 domain-containing protein [Chloroflexota bacterium]
METTRQAPQIRRDLLVAAAVFAAAFALYLRTLAPSVAFLFDDSLEFQYVVPRLGILHQTGYPFYTLLGKLFTLLVPVNDPAFRLNLFSALNGALAVAMVYFVARHLTAFRFAALIAALTFAVGQTFWSQAVIAETYTLQMLIVALMLCLVLTWKEEAGRLEACAERSRSIAATKTQSRPSSAGGESTKVDLVSVLPRFQSPAARLYLLAFVMGLGLTHHRLILLLYPAITFYVLLVSRNILREWRTLLRAAFFFLLPLTFYLYLPLRGAVGSANGEYQNTLQGFWEWITAQQYTVFLTDNPLQVQRDVAYYVTLLQDQFGVLGLALAAVGIVWLLRRPREWALLVLALITQAIFVFNYRVADVEVHFLTTFLLLTLFVAAGADGLLAIITNYESHRDASQLRITNFATLLAGLLLLLIPVNLLITNYSASNLSDKWDIHDYGLDILRQPLEPNAAIIGIQGEMTVLRYFQETQNIRPDVQTIAADKEDARLAAVDRALRENRAVYLTRPLKGVAAKYSLTSLGPLIRAQAKPAPDAPKISLPLDEDFGTKLKLLGYDLDATRLNSIPAGWHVENGRTLGVTLYWQALEKLDADVLVSLKLLSKDQQVVAQMDRRPVHDAYPTAAWRAGEVVADTHTVPVFLGVPTGEYTLNVTLYDGESGVVVGKRDLQTVALAPDLIAPRFALGPDRAAPRSDAWNINPAASGDFGALTLVGHSLAADGPIRPGDALPLTLLWRAGSAPIANNLQVRIWLEDSDGKSVASRDAPVGVALPVSFWQPNQFVRDWPRVRVPANIADGSYTVKMAAARRNEFLGANWLPFGPTTAKLGQITIKSRPRIMEPSLIPNPLETIFDRKIKLLGYELERDRPARGVRVTLYWRALAPTETSYTVFVHLLDSRNQVIVSGDAVPGGGDLPTTGWIEGEYVTDIHSFTMPGDLAEGTYPIEIGLYDPVSGARLKTADGQDRVILISLNEP